MAKVAGDHCTVSVDNSSGTATDISDDVTSVEIPDTFDMHDVAGMEAVHHFVPGQEVQEITLNGNFNAASNQSHAVLSGIVGKTDGSTVTIAIGANAAPTTGDPEFSGEFVCDNYQVTIPNSGPATWTAHFSKYGSTAAAWGTKS